MFALRPHTTRRPAALSYSRAPAGDRVPPLADAGQPGPHRTTTSRAIDCRQRRSSRQADRTRSGSSFARLARAPADEDETPAVRPQRWRAACRGEASTWVVVGSRWGVVVLLTAQRGRVVCRVTARGQGLPGLSVGRDLGSPAFGLPSARRLRSRTSPGGAGRGRAALRCVRLVGAARRRGIE